MSLNWQIDSIKDYKTVCWMENGEMNPVTNVLIWGTISVGIGQITDKNVDEFAARFRIIEKLDGPFLIAREEKRRYVTDEEFIAHIGLSTNVHTETRAKWASRHFTIKQTSVTEQYARSFRSMREKEQAA